jgi:hypothetical protein
VHRQRERADSFGAVARAYDQFRPRYPAQLIDDLVAPRIETALDVGAGTGISSRQLATAASTCSPLNPIRGWRDRRREGIRTQLAKFESWDAAGRRSTWSCSRSRSTGSTPTSRCLKVRRMLTERGRLALVWNRLFPVEPSRDDFAPIYRATSSPAPLTNAVPTSGAGSGWTSAGRRHARGCGFAVAQRTYHRKAHFDCDQWLGLVFTYSNHLVLPARAAASCGTAWQSASVPAVSRWAATPC